jgi:hypothetical protein
MKPTSSSDLHPQHLHSYLFIMFTDKEKQEGNSSRQTDGETLVMNPIPSPYSHAQVLSRRFEEKSSLVENFQTLTLPSPWM